MTLTVIDGDFPRQVLAADNLTFSPFEMSTRKNTATLYDARQFGPATKRPGTVTWGKLTSVESAAPQDSHVRSWRWGIAAGMAVVWCGWRRRMGTRLLIFLTVMLGSIAWIGSATAQESSPSVAKVLQILSRLEEERSIDPAALELAECDAKAVVALTDVVRGESRLARRGWAVVLLTQIGGNDVREALRDLQRDSRLSPLVGTWVKAGQVQLCNSPRELLQQFAGGPLDESLHRPFELRLMELSSAASELPPTAELLRFTAMNPSFNARIAPWLRQIELSALVAAMLDDADATVRRQAAAVLAMRAQDTDRSAIVERIGDRLRFRMDADVPWSGGPLFLPSADWSRQEARQLIRPLLAWWLWCETHNQQDDTNVIRNNLWSLRNMAGLRSGGSLDDWLLEWGREVSAQEVEQMFAEQSLEGKRSLRNKLKALDPRRN